MKKSSLFLIAILFSSLFSITDISVYGINDQIIETNFNDIETNLSFVSQIVSTDHNVLLLESITLVTSDESNNKSIDRNISQQQIQSTKNIKLNEKLSILENDKLDNLINLVKHNSEKLAILERVNPNRMRDNTKFDEIITSSSISKPTVNDYNISDLISQQLLNVNLDLVQYSIPTFSIFDFAHDNNIFSNNYDLLIASAQNIISVADENNQYWQILH